MSVAALPIRQTTAPPAHHCRLPHGLRLSGPGAVPLAAGGWARNCGGPTAGRVCLALVAGFALAGRWQLLGGLLVLAGLAAFSLQDAEDTTGRIRA